MKNFIKTTDKNKIYKLKKQLIYIRDLFKVTPKKGFRYTEIQEYISNNFKDKYEPYIEDEKIIRNTICNYEKFENLQLYVYLVSTIIDACYSTQVRRFSNMNNVCEKLVGAQKLISCLTKPCDIEILKNEIYEIINIIKEDSSIGKTPFSFLTKFFALHRKRFNSFLEALPIYDKYVQLYLDVFYAEKNKKNNKFKKEDYNYLDFYESMNGIRSKLKLDFDELDKKIWHTAKCLQFLFNKDSNIEYIDDLIESHLKFLNECDFDDMYFKKLIIDIKNSSKKKKQKQDN